MTSRHASARALVALTGLAAMVLLALPAAASSRSAAPGPPTGIHVTKISPSSFTVAVDRAPNAQKYRVYAAMKPKNLAVAKLPKDALVATSSHPSVTLKGLHYRTAPYYYRVETMNGVRRKFSLPAKSIGLLPATPTGLRATSDSTGTYLTWNAVAVTGFSVEQATDSAMTQNVHTYTLRGQDNQFTPYGLTGGTTYYFRIRSENAGTPSAYTATVQATVTSNEQPLSVMTYNVLEASDDGRSEGGNTVAPWSQRGPAIAKLIEQAAPDVVAVQEAASWVAAVKGPREIDSLTSLLDGAYSLADTEIPPSQPHFARTGVYILYKSSTYRAIGTGGHWDLGNTRWAAYQILQNRETGAKVLFVAVHLLVGAGAANDTRREAETKSLLTQAGSYAASNGVPVVYAGDFNSDRWAHHAFNAPELVMRDAHTNDAFDVAQKRTNARYNTAEGYATTPPANGARIDYVFAPPGVGVQTWGLVMNLVHGKFVGIIPSDHNPLVSDVDFPY